jgi:excisionase family DNA binding protein
MAETQNKGGSFEAILEAIVRRVVREEIAAANDKQAPLRRDWLKAEEAAKEYGLPKTWFEERGRAGEIARVKPGRYVLFKRRDIEQYLERHKQNGKKQEESP